MNIVLLYYIIQKIKSKIIIINIKKIILNNILFQMIIREMSMKRVSS